MPKRVTAEMWAMPLGSKESRDPPTARYLRV
ncbi:hypothetical protein KN1_12670 [Stygiolobus caldivivus]|uniref:Uncharacterized protein n=1 Tax=Stygiolobus caldivivus TaxID=2824673 RepID=A0A8D5U5K9_9CREN|nr:hypothetical protein KN1_12670 [Stygiolobus caldivivus]